MENQLINRFCVFHSSTFISAGTVYKIQHIDYKIYKRANTNYSQMYVEYSGAEALQNLLLHKEIVGTLALVQPRNLCDFQICSCTITRFFFVICNILEGRCMK